MEKRAGRLGVMIFLGGATAACGPGGRTAPIVEMSIPAPPAPSNADASASREEAILRSHATLVTELRSLEAELRATSPGKGGRDRLLERLRSGHTQLSAAAALDYAEAIRAVVDASDERTRSAAQEIADAAWAVHGRAWESAMRFDRQLKAEYPGR